MEYKKEIIEIEPFHIEWNEKTGEHSRISIWGKRPKGEVHYEIRIKFKTFWGSVIARIIRKWLTAEIKEKETDRNSFAILASTDDD